MIRPLLLPWRGVSPRIDPTAWIAPNATIIGDVEIGPGASVWFGTILRGDVNFIRIGARSNIQDGSVVHVTTRKHTTIIGNDVLIGHMAMIHGCVIEDGAFIGMKVCVMDGVVVESGAMVAAGALVTPGKRVRSGEVWAGSPAKFMRAISEDERANMKDAPKRYAALAAEYKASGVG